MYWPHLGYDKEPDADICISGRHSVGVPPTIVHVAPSAPPERTAPSHPPSTRVGAPRIRDDDAMQQTPDLVPATRDVARALDMVGLRIALSPIPKSPNPNPNRRLPTPHRTKGCIHLYAPRCSLPLPRTKEKKARSMRRHQGAARYALHAASGISDQRSHWSLICSRSNNLR